MQVGIHPTCNVTKATFGPLGLKSKKNQKKSQENKNLQKFGRDLVASGSSG